MHGLLWHILFITYRVLSDVKLVVYQRQGCCIEDRVYFEEVVRIHNVECITVPSLSDISSSAIREHIKCGNSAILDREEVLCKEVKDYLLEHNLYLS